jgi:thioredoxin 1
MNALYFTAKWCSVCRTIAPIVVKLQKDGYDIEKVDVDDSKEKEKQYGVISLPTLVILNGDKEIKRFTGRFTEEQVRASMSRKNPDYIIW